MSNSIAPGSSAAVNVNVTALTTNPNVPVQYKTIILKKNLVNGVNTLTQEMMSAQNTKYVIKYDYVLGEDITVPTGCILEFDGGSISASGSNDTITGNNTGIQAGLVKILNTDVTLVGAWNVVCAYPEWFGAKVYTDWNVATDSTLPLNKTLASFSTIVLQQGLYKATDTLLMRRNTKLCGSGTSSRIVFAKTNGSLDKYMLQLGTEYVYSSEHTIIQNIGFTDHSDQENSVCTWLGIYLYSSAHIDNVYVGHARNAITVAPYYIDSVKITRCNFFYNGNYTTYPDDPYIMNISPNTGDGYLISQIHIPHNYSDISKCLKLACLENSKVEGCLIGCVYIASCKSLSIDNCHHEVYLDKPTYKITSSFVSITNSYFWKNKIEEIELSEGDYAQNMVSLENLYIYYNDSKEYTNYFDINCSTNSQVLTIKNCYTVFGREASMSSKTYKGLKIQNIEIFNFNSALCSIDSIVNDGNVDFKVRGSINKNLNFYYAGRTSHVPCLTDEYQSNITVCGIAIADFNRKISIGNPTTKSIPLTQTAQGILYIIPQGIYSFIVYKGTDANTYNKYAISTSCSGRRSFDNGVRLDNNIFIDRTAGPIDNFTKVDDYEFFNRGVNLRMWVSGTSVPTTYGIFVVGDEFILGNQKHLYWNGTAWVDATGAIV